MPDVNFLSNLGITERFIEQADGTHARRVSAVEKLSAGTDRSIVTSIASAVLMAANTARVRFFVKNDTGIVVWINFGATAVAAAGSGNIAIAASGGFFEFAGSTGAVNIIAASGTPAITAREF